MFDFIRTHQRLMQLILLVLILPSFAFFGLQSYNKMGETSAGVAKVAGRTIQQSEFEIAQRNQAQRLQREMGAQFDPKLLDSPEAKAQILNGLIAEHVALNEVKRHSMYVGNASVQQAIAAMPGIATLFGPDGKFDVERYDLMLGAQNMTRDQFFADVRRSLLLKQVVDTVKDSVIVPKALESRLSALLRQERDVSELKIKLSDLQSRARVDPEMVQKYYDTHPKEFEIPERVKVEYVVLDSNAVAAQVSVPPEAAEEYYKQNKARYEVSEERRASHILISAPKDASAEDKQKARMKAEEVLNKAKANPADFAKLAKQYSQDPGSANNGGDLGYLGKGATVAPFEKALYALKQNQISDLVETDFGYHIIVLTGIKPASTRTLESVRDEIVGEIRKQLLAKKYAESAEMFSNMVYEQADSLKPVADKFALKVQVASGVTRVPAKDADPKSPLSHPKVLAAVFTDDVLKNKHNTAAIEVSPNTFVAARVIEYKPAERRPLSEVAESIKTTLTKLEAKKLTQQAGEAKLEELRKGGAAQGFSSPALVSRNNQANIPREALSAIFKADVSTLPAYIGVALTSGDYAIYRIDRVQVPKADVSQNAMLGQSLANEHGAMETGAYLESLKKAADIKIYPPYSALASKDSAVPGLPQ